MELNEISVFSPPSASMSGPPDDQSVCPICSHEVKLYFINFNEKIEMCGNVECDYPFGYVPLKLLKEDYGAQIVDEKSIRSKSSSSTVSMSSLASISGWSDVEKMCNIFDNGIPGLDLNKIKHSNLLENTVAAKNKEEIKKNVEKIKQITKSMNRRSKATIKNERWLKNLSYLQELSGVNLMKPEEIKNINKKETFLGMGELKIDIDKTNKSTIKIQINHQSEPNKK